MPTDNATPNDHSTTQASPDSSGASPAQARKLRFTLHVNAENEPYPLLWIPAQTAGAVHFADCQDPAYAQNTGEGAVVDLGKVVLVDGEEDVEQLTVGDWALLARAWAGLPPLKLPLREREFEPYRVAFDRYKGYAKPNDFDLSPMVGNMGTDIYLTVRRTIDEHEIELKRWVKEGLVVPRSRSSMVKLPGTWGTGAGLVLDDLRKFAGALQIDVHVAQPDARAKTAADMAAMSDFEQRKYLLGEFRAIGGRVFGVDLEKSRSGALSELADRIDRNKSSLYDRLRKAALEEAASGKANAVGVPAKAVAKAGPFDMVLKGKR